MRLLSISSGPGHNVVSLQEIGEVSDNGYMGKILLVDLSKREVSHLPTSVYADRFIGGRGIAAKLYWDRLMPGAGALDPGNPLILMTGPVTGLVGLGSAQCQVVTKSPIANPERFCYSSFAGHWGAQLKFAGYDGLVVEGASEGPVYLSIADDSVEIRDASHLWQRSSFEVRCTIKKDLGRDVRILCTGPAGDNQVRFANLLSDGDGSGSSGAGAVMGSKRLKAIAVRGTQKVRVADPARLESLVERVRDLKRVDPNVYPPSGLQPESLAQLKVRGGAAQLRRQACFGCPGLCEARVSFRAQNGTRGKFMCHPAMFYGIRAHRYYGEDTEVPFFAARLCNEYGLDTMPVETTIQWLVRCVKAGFLTEDNTGLPVSKVGSHEFIEALVRKIAFREGFGDVLSNGPTRAAEIAGGCDYITDYVCGYDQPNAYDPRVFIYSGLLYAMEPRQPISQLHHIGLAIYRWYEWHRGGNTYVSSDVLRSIAKRFWGSELAVDFSTYEGKAMSAMLVQNRDVVNESLILCNFAWPITFVDGSDDHVGDPEMESRVFSAVTGREVDEQSLYRVGERIFNLQRAVLARDGHRGRESDRLREVFFAAGVKTDPHSIDCWVPGKDGQPFQKKGATLDNDKFEALKSEYYQLRGWDPPTGLQTVSKLRGLALTDVAGELVKIGAAVDC